MQLDEQRRADLVRRLQTFFLEEWEEDISQFRTDQLMDFVLEAVGPQIYNQAVADARKFMQEKLDDLDGAVYATELD